MRSDDIVERAVPLWWSHHRPTPSRGERILFGLVLIFPSDNTRQAVYAASVFHFATGEFCQVVQVHKRRCVSVAR